MTFRDDLDEASDFVASYLDTVGERPVVPPSRRATCARRCRSRRRSSGEPFADVLRDVERADRARAHALEPPALLRVLRRSPAPSRASSPSC